MIRIIQGDITKISVDAIVNAANSALLGGGGVDGAIHRAGGPKVLEDCMKIRARQGGCAVGEAVITTAGNLPAKHVIHTVGPVWNGGSKGEEALLAQCYRNCLLLAEAHGLRSISFPGISTGIYRFPKALAAQVAWRTVHEAWTDLKCLQEVYFVCFDAETYGIYTDLQEGQPPLSYIRG